MDRRGLKKVSVGIADVDNGGMSAGILPRYNGSALVDSKVSESGTAVSVSGSVAVTSGMTAKSLTLSSGLTVSGSITGKFEYGGISVEANGSAVSVASANVFYQVTQFDTNDSSNKVTPDHTNDHITIGSTGIYWVHYSVSARCAGAASIAFQVEKNNGATALAQTRTTQTVGATEKHTMAKSVPISLTSGDTLELWTQNESDTSNITVEDGCLEVFRLA